jgi:hypothetical protein
MEEAGEERCRWVHLIAAVLMGYDENGAANLHAMARVNTRECPR